MRQAGLLQEPAALQQVCRQADGWGRGEGGRGGTCGLQTWGGRATAAACPRAAPTSGPLPQSASAVRTWPVAAGQLGPQGGTDEALEEAHQARHQRAGDALGRVTLVPLPLRTRVGSSRATSQTVLRGKSALVQQNPQMSTTTPCLAECCCAPHPSPPTPAPPPCAAHSRRSWRPQRRAPPAGCPPQTGRRRTPGGRAAGAGACAPHTAAAVPPACRHPGSCAGGGGGPEAASQVGPGSCGITVQAEVHATVSPRSRSLSQYSSPHLTATAMSRSVSTIWAPVKSRWPSCSGWWERAAASALVGRPNP